MNKGKVAEFNKPSVLLSDDYQDNVFRQLVDETGTATASHLKKVANGTISIFDDLEAAAAASSSTPKVAPKRKKNGKTAEDLKDSHHHEEEHSSHNPTKPLKNKKKKRAIGKPEKIEIHSNGITNVEIHGSELKVNDDDEEELSEVVEEEEEEEY